MGSIFGADTNNGSANTTYGAYFIGFKNPPVTPTTGSIDVTVKHNSSPVVGVTVQAYKDGTTATGTPQITKADGTAKLENLPAGSYVVKATGRGTVGSVKYDAGATSVSASVTVNLGDTPAAATATITAGFTMAPTTDGLTVKVVNRQGVAVGAVSNVSWTAGGSMTIAAGTGSNPYTYEVTNPAAGPHTLKVQNVTGYVPLTAEVTLTTASGKITGVTASKASSSPAGDSDVTVESDNTIVVTLAEPTTAVTLPLPLPVDKDNQTLKSDDVSNLKATFTPDSSMPAEAAAALRKELGGTGAKEVSLVKDPENGNTALQKVTLPATALPDGVYRMTVTGDGMTQTGVTVTVKDGVVNVGGTPAFNSSTKKLESVTGGVTVQNTTDQDAYGNYTVSMLQGRSSNNNLYATNGATPTVVNLSANPPAAITGLTAANTATEDLLTLASKPGSTPVPLPTPTPSTDPMYFVQVTKKTTTEYEAKIYLKGVKASGGVAGLFVDPNLFDLSTGTSLLSMESSIVRTLPVSAVRNIAGVEVNATYAYVTFNWTTIENGNVVDGFAGANGTLIATLTLPTQGGKDISSQLAKGSVRVQPFTETGNGKAVIAANKAGTDLTITTYWREQGQAASESAFLKHKALEVGKEQHGGFYQVTGPAYESDGVTLKGAMRYDVRTEVEMPPEVTDWRLEFRVVDKNGNPIENAEVKLYNKTDVSEDDAKSNNPVTATEIDKKTTPATGLVGFSVPYSGGDYWYLVKHKQNKYFDYPNGKSNTDTDNFVLDWVRVDGTTGKATTMLDIFPDNALKNPPESTKTPIVADEVYVVMETKSFHKVKLGEKNDGTVTPLNGATVPATNVTLISSGDLYDKIEYSFKLSPKTGWTWNLTTGGTYTTMDDIANALGVYVYTTYQGDKSNVPDATTEEQLYEVTANNVGGKNYPLQLAPVGGASGVKVTWDAGSSSFKLAAGAVDESPIGDVTFAGGSVPTALTGIYDALRGGNVVIVVPGGTGTSSVLKKAEYKVTVSAGEHVEMTVSEHTTAPTGRVATPAGNYKKQSSPTDSALMSLPMSGSPLASGDLTGNPITVEETMTGGSTVTAVYKFTPDDPTQYEITALVVNGMQQPVTPAMTDATGALTYTGYNISGDTTVIVKVSKKNTPVNPEDPTPPPTPQANPTITVTLGHNGKASFDTAATDNLGNAVAASTAITGATQVTYSFAVGDEPEITITPNGPPPQGAKQYQLDTVVITLNEGDADEVVYTLDGAGSTTKLTYAADGNGYNTPQLGFKFPAADMVAGRHHSVAVTFKEASPTAVSEEAIIDCVIVGGLGNVYVSGTKVLAVGDTASYVIVPKSGGDWSFDNTANSGALMLTEPGAAMQDVSHKVSAAAAVAGWDYTTPQLKGGKTLLEVTFKEKSYNVTGQVRVAYYDPASGSTRTVEAATLTFVREAKAGDYNASTEVRYTTEVARWTDTSTNKYVVFSTVSQEGSAATGTMSFDIQLPRGIWTLTVSKVGYLDHVIKDFEIKGTETAAIAFGSGTSDTTAKVIDLTAGNASGTGFSIGADDMSVIAMGWASATNGAAGSVGQLIRSYADIDESSLSAGAGTLSADPRYTGRSSDTTDVGYVTANLNVRYQEDTYSTWKKS